MSFGGFDYGYKSAILKFCGNLLSILKNPAFKKKYQFHIKKHKLPRHSNGCDRRVFDMLPESDMTFEELTEWYLDLKFVKKLASYGRIETASMNFNKVLGHKIVKTGFAKGANARKRTISCQPC